MKLPRWIFPGHPMTSRRVPENPRLRVFNLNRQTVLADNLQIADTSAKRNKGLLGRKGLAAGEGLWISPCESVHTFGMQFSIDLVYIDREHRIRKLRSNVPPWRVSACLIAHSVIELPSGTIHASQSQIGDRLNFSDVPYPAGEEANFVASSLNRESSLAKS